MIGLIIGFVAYLVASTGYFGGDLVCSLDVLENWYWFVVVLSGLIAGFIVLVFTGLGGAVGHDAGGKVGAGITALGGSILGLFIAAMIMIKVGLQLWLTIWLMDSINPMAEAFDDITTKQMLALGFLVLMAFIPGFNNSSSSSSKEKKS